MKNLSILFFAAAMMSLASCKKDYTCTCTTLADGDKLVTTRDVPKTSKKTAEAICGDYSQVYTYTYNNGSVQVVETETQLTTCELK